MVKLTDYTRYADAQRHYGKDALWDLFDGDRQEINIAHECVDRHRGKGVAIRISCPPKADGNGHEVISFDELSEWSGRIAGLLLQRGIAAGDRVAIMLEPSLAFYAGLFGVMKAGAVAVPLFTLFGPEGLRLRVEDCEASLLIVPDDKLALGQACGVPSVLTATDLLDGAASAPELAPARTSASDFALFQYTSGTTREMPDAIKHPHRSVVTVALAALYATGVRPGDRFMCPSSPAWGHGLAHGTLGPLGLGVSTSSYAGPFEAERLLQATEAFGITNLSAAATHYRLMRQCADHERHHFALRKLTFTGEPLDSETAAWACATFGQEVRSIYGTTEVGVILGQYPGADDFPVRRGSLGLPMPGLDVAVLDASGRPCPPGEVGEIMVRRRNGWFSTKDRGHTDGDGVFYHDGRADDVIISAGWTISAKEVEDCLLRHPAVADVAVIGTPDDLRGLVVTAFVAVSQPVTAQTLQDFVRVTLSAHEYPRRVFFVNAIPKTPAGKTNRRAVRESYEREHAQESSTGPDSGAPARESP